MSKIVPDYLGGWRLTTDDEVVVVSGTNTKPYEEGAEDEGYRNLMKGVRRMNDVLMSVKVALFEEKRKVSMCKEFFNNDDYTIMATRRAIEHIQFGIYPLVFNRDSDEIRLFGHKVEVINGDDLRMYLAKEIKVIEWSELGRSEEDAKD